jgi:hypothetical protein
MVLADVGDAYDGTSRGVGDRTFLRKSDSDMLWILAPCSCCHQPLSRRERMMTSAEDVTCAYTSNEANSSEPEFHLPARQHAIWNGISVAPMRCQFLPKGIPGLLKK